MIRQPFLSRLPLASAGVFSAILLALSAPAQESKPSPAATAGTIDPKSAAPAAPEIKPSEEEFSLDWLEKPSPKASSAAEAYKAGKFDDARKQAEAAAKDDANAAFILALCHQNGRGGAVSVPEAERNYRLAADKGHVSGKTALGLLLYATSGNDKDRIAEAVSTLKAATKTDPARTALVVGELYARGIGVTSDFDEAMNYFDMAIKANQPRGHLAKGLLHAGTFGFEKRVDQKKAEESLKAGADAGLLDAMLILGRSKLGQSKGKDALFDEGVKWLESAGAKGSGEALLNIGFLYEEGRLVAKDEKKALSYFDKAAVSGYAPAIAKLGSCYEKGIGTEKDAAKAFKAYNEAAEKGLPLAIYNLAICHDQGIGTSKDAGKAFLYFSASARAGLAAGMTETGLRYQAGNGIPADVVAAGAWLSLAAQNKSVPAQVALARMSLQGVGVPRNMEMAAQLYSAALAGGSADAAFELAQMFELGVGVGKDVVKAHALYFLAAEAKTNGATERRDALAKTLTKDQLTKSELLRKELVGEKPAEPAKKDEAKKEEPKKK